MMFPILAQSAVVGSSSNWTVVTTLGVLLTLAINAVLFVRMASGKSGERQIEPTQLAALQSQLDRNHAAAQAELKSQTVMLNEINRESGATKATVEAIAKDVATIRTEHRAEIDKAHQRMNGMSRELAGTTARVDGLERREENG
jgi:hypothetical protein